LTSEIAQFTAQDPIFERHKIVSGDWFGNR